MGGIKIGVKGTKPFQKSIKHFQKQKDAFNKIDLNVYGKMGVEALHDATPKDSGESAESWDYEIVKEKDGARIIFTNSKVVGYDTVPVVMLIQYGHMTKGGVYIEGRDFINPALKPVYDKLSKDIWKEVTKR